MLHSYYVQSLRNDIEGCFLTRKLDGNSSGAVLYWYIAMTISGFQWHSPQLPHSYLSHCRCIALNSLCDL